MKGTKSTKILVGGNRTAAKRFIGPANSQMEILKKQMSFQNRSQGIRRIWLHDDVYVECIKCFNYQECRIWVRPQVSKEEEKERKAPLHFYVRIVCEVEGREIDRIIIWRCREEVKSDSLSNSIDYIETGVYENGLQWGITKAGAVILDVDTITDTVYSESGGVSVETFLTEKEQVTLAKRYISQINDGDVPEDLSTDYQEGSLYSPFDLYDACDGSYNIEEWDDDVEPVTELYFDDDWFTFYHMGAKYYPPDWVAYEVADQGSSVGCSAAQTIFFDHDWPDLDKNREKYLPSNRRLGAIYENPIKEAIPCGGVHSEPKGEPVQYTCTSLKEINQAMSIYAGECGFPVENYCSHLKGNFYTTGKTYPCFFVTQRGIGNEIHEDRGHFDGTVQPDGTCYISGLYGSAEVRIRDSFYQVSTPLELVDAEEMALKFENLSPCSETIGLAVYFGCPEYIEISDVYDEMQQGVSASEYWPAFPVHLLWKDGPDFPNNYATLYTVSEGITPDQEEHTRSFWSSFFMAKDTQNNNKYASLMVYSEINRKTSAHVGYRVGVSIYSYWCNGVEIENTNDIPEVPGYATGVLFYIMHPDYFTLRNEDGEVEEYWDIHSEREADPNEINHNRLLDLEDYVNDILNVLKEMPENIEYAGEEIDHYKWLTEEQEYEINSGFIYQLH